MPPATRPRITCNRRGSSTRSRWRSASSTNPGACRWQPRDGGLSDLACGTDVRLAAMSKALPARSHPREGDRPARRSPMSALVAQHAHARRALAMKERASAGCHSHHNDDVGVSDLATSAREKELRHPRDRLGDKAVLAGCGALAVILVTEQIGGLLCTPAAEIKPRLESPGCGDSSIGSTEAGVTASSAEQPAP
jgi:hypothetical protein